MNTYQKSVYLTLLHSTQIARSVRKEKYKKYVPLAFKAFTPATPSPSQSGEVFLCESFAANLYDTFGFARIAQS